MATKKAVGTAAKASGAIAAGGGPEDPVGDAAAAGIIVKDSVASKGQQKGVKDQADKASKSTPSGGDKGAKPPAKGAPASDGGGGGGKGNDKLKRSVAWAWSGDRKLLTMEYVACVVVVIAGTLVAPSDSKDTAMRALVKGSALSALFLVLSLASVGGKGAAKTATAIGTLVTMTYVLTSSDVHNLITWTGGFFSKDGVKQAQDVAAEAEAAKHETTSTTGFTY